MSTNYQPTNGFEHPIASRARFGDGVWIITLCFKDESSVAIVQVSAEGKIVAYSGPR